MFIAQIVPPWVHHKALTCEDQLQGAGQEPRPVPSAKKVEHMGMCLLEIDETADMAVLKR